MTSNRALQNTDNKNEKLERIWNIISGSFCHNTKGGILNDPRQCKFDVATLLCKGVKKDSCLSQEQLIAVKTYYGGPKDSEGKFLYYGFPFGGETGRAPDQITAYFVDEKMQPAGSRLICPYPQVARYDGEGDTREVSSFSCVNAD